MGSDPSRFAGSRPLQACELRARHEPLFLDGNGSWSATWRSGWASPTSPGHGTHTEGQAMERFWRTRKDTTAWVARL